MNTLMRMLRYRLYRRAYINPRTEQGIVDGFHKLYYELHHFGETWHNTFWMGVPTQKCPLDLWIYQEIIYETRPDVIIESGTADGGGALYLAYLSEMIDKGRVITIDIKEKKGRPLHKRIQYMVGSSTDGEIVKQVKGQISQTDKVMVILDSDHRKEHVLKELHIYGPLVTRGNYLIVEDSNLNGHPVHQDHGPGPMEAIEEFLISNKEYIVDAKREKFRLTFNPRGYLRRVS